jgi:GT2 family glycosyltransferase
VEQHKVTIGLILLRNEHYLKLSLGSLAAQDYPNLEILVRDQSPNGEAYDYVQKEMPEVFAKITLSKGENLMHSGGHNALIRKMTGEWYFCASNDMWYPKDFVSKMVTELQKPEYSTFGSASPKLLRWDFKFAENDLEASKTKAIDSVGLGLTKCHKFIDVGQGEEDKGQYDSRTSIFGTSAAAGLYRKSALEDVAWTNHVARERNVASGKVEKEYFDETLHYKNDVDLAYRLQWAGHKCLFIPLAQVWHDRQASGHSAKSAWAKGNSYFGQLVTVSKNWSPDFSWPVKLLTGLRQAALWVYAFILDRPLLQQRAEVEKVAPLIEAKRKAMLRRIKVEEVERFMK